MFVEIGSLEIIRLSELQVQFPVPLPPKKNFQETYSWQFFVPFLGRLSDPFKG